MEKNPIKSQIVQGVITIENGVAGHFYLFQSGWELFPATRSFHLSFLNYSMNDLQQHVLSLSPGERLQLVSFILASLSSDELTHDPHIPSAWIKEAQASIAEKTWQEWQESGHSGYTMDDVTAMIEQKRMAKGKKAS